MSVPLRGSVWLVSNEPKEFEVVGHTLPRSGTDLNGAENTEVAKNVCGRTQAKMAM